MFFPQNFAQILSCQILDNCRVLSCRAIAFNFLYYYLHSGIYQVFIHQVLHTSFFVLFCFVSFSIPFIIFALLFSLPPINSRNSDPGSHSRLFSLPTTVRALHFYREKISALFSLVDSRRIVLTHARRSQQLILFLFFQINSKSRHGGIRTHGPTLVAFEGYHWSTGATKNRRGKYRSTQFIQHNAHQHKS